MRPILLAVLCLSACAGTPSRIPPGCPGGPPQAPVMSGFVQLRVERPKTNLANCPLPEAPPVSVRNGGVNRGTLPGLQTLEGAQGAP